MKHLIRDSGSLEFVKRNVSFLRAEHLGLMSVLRVWTHRSHLILEGWTPRPWCHVSLEGWTPRPWSHVSLEGWTPRSHVSVEDHGLMLVLRVWTPRSHLILEGWTPRSHLSVEDHGLMLVLRVWTPRSHLILEGWTPRSHVSLEDHCLMSVLRAEHLGLMLVLRVWTPRSHVSREGEIQATVRLEVRRNFFTQRVVGPWNQLPTHIVKAPTVKVNALKNRYRTTRWRVVADASAPNIYKYK